MVCVVFTTVVCKWSLKIWLGSTHRPHTGQKSALFRTSFRRTAAQSANNHLTDMACVRTNAHRQLTTNQIPLAFLIWVVNECGGRTRKSLFRGENGVKINQLIRFFSSSRIYVCSVIIELIGGKKFGNAHYYCVNMFGWGNKSSPE